MMPLRKWTVEVARRLTSLLLSLCIFSKKCCGKGRQNHGGCLGFWFPDFPWVTWPGSRDGVVALQSSRDPCLTRQTCNLIYPISGARIEAWVVMRTDKRTGSSIKEAFMSRVLDALHAVLTNLCADHKATVCLYRLGTRKSCWIGLDHISSWKWCEPNVPRDFWRFKPFGFKWSVWQKLAPDAVMGAVSEWVCVMEQGVKVRENRGSCWPQAF